MLSSTLQEDRHHPKNHKEDILHKSSHQNNSLLDNEAERSLKQDSRQSDHLEQ